MSANDQQVLVGLGCDYITATTREVNATRRLHSLATSVFRFQADVGNTPRPWGMAGYKGWRCGSVEIGQKGDGLLVRMSSDSAQMYWSKVWDACDNVSRLDLQATVRVMDGPTKRIKKHQREAESHSCKNADIPIVRWTADHRGGYTLYLGARTSICFGRIYDKHAQSKEKIYEECVRYEVQFHNKLAVSIARGLSLAQSQKTRIAANVSQFFHGRGIHLELPYDDRATYCCSRQRSDNDKCLSWLSASVRPSVQRLIDAGRGHEVFEALGLIQNTEVDQ